MLVIECEQLLHAAECLRIDDRGPDRVSKPVPQLLRKRGLVFPLSAFVDFFFADI